MFKFQAISTWVNGKLKTVMTPLDSTKKVQVIEREIVDGEMIQVITNLWIIPCKNLGE